MKLILQVLGNFEYEECNYVIEDKTIEKVLLQENQLFKIMFR